MPLRDDIGDRRIAAEIVHDVVATLGVTFTIDGACNDDGSNAHFEKFCSPSKSFLDTQVDGETLWLNPPFNRIDEFLDHYLVCKSRSPRTTSACLVLPDWQAPWRDKVANMKIVKQFPKGSLLFDQPKGKDRKRMGPTPWGVTIYYDAPVQETVYAASATALQSGLRMRFEAKLNGHKVVALVDTGALTANLG